MKKGLTLALIVPILSIALRWLQNRGSSISKQKISFFVLIGTFYFCPYLARADTRLEVSQSHPLAVSEPNPPIPDVSGWTVVQKPRIKMRISKNVVVYLGLDVEYRNPADSKEFTRVISRHTPMIFGEYKQRNARLFREAVAALYTKKEEQDRLSKLDGEVDPVLYIQWRTKTNPRTGKDMQDGDASIWCLDSNGKWLFIQNERLVIQFLSENVGNGKLRNILAGRKYQIGDVSHIFKVDRNDLVRLAEQED